MNWKKILNITLKVPLGLIILGSFAASIYAYYFKISNVGIASPIILGTCIILYIISLFINDRKLKETSV